MAKKYHNIGSMKTKKDKDADGQVQYLIELDKAYLGKIFIYNETTKEFVPMSGKYINVDRPTAKYDRMLKAGTIKEDEYDQKTSVFAPDGKASHVKFDLQIVTEE